MKYQSALMQVTLEGETVCPCCGKPTDSITIGICNPFEYEGNPFTVGATVDCEACGVKSAEIALPCDTVISAETLPGLLDTVIKAARELSGK